MNKILDKVLTANHSYTANFGDKATQIGKAA